MPSLFCLLLSILFCLLSSPLLLLLLSCISRVWLCATPSTAAHQAPLSLGFSRQEHWSGLPFPCPVQESKKWKWSRSVVSDSSQLHGLQPTRLLHPWDFPGKSTGVGCHCLLHSPALDLTKWSIKFCSKIYLHKPLQISPAQFDTFLSRLRIIILPTKIRISLYIPWFIFKFPSLI